MRCRHHFVAMGGGCFGEFEGAKPEEAPVTSQTGVDVDVNVDVIVVFMREKIVIVK